jgi:hypothetical protein
LGPGMGDFRAGSIKISFANFAKVSRNEVGIMRKFFAKVRVSVGKSVGFWCETGRSGNEGGSAITI